MFRVYLNSANSDSDIFLNGRRLVHFKWTAARPLLNGQLGGVVDGGQAGLKIVVFFK